MSARGDAARRARWAARDKQWEAAQLEAALDSWLTSLPPHLIQRLHDELFAIFGQRYRSSNPLNATVEERDRTLALLEEINRTWDAGHDPSDSQPGHEENSMSLEQAIAANTAAVEALTAAIKAGGGASTSGKAPKETKTADKVKPAHSREELAAMMGKVKAEKGAEVAKALIKSDGKSDKLAEVAEENIDALFAAAEAKLAEEEAL